MGDDAAPRIYVIQRINNILPTPPTISFPVDSQWVIAGIIVILFTEPYLLHWPKEQIRSKSITELVNSR